VLGVVMGNVRCRAFFVAYMRASLDVGGENTQIEGVVHSFL
jgi:hypothetical protein